MCKNEIILSFITSFSVYLILYMFQEIMKPPKEILNLKLVSIYFQSLYKTPVSTVSVNIPCQ